MTFIRGDTSVALSDQTRIQMTSLGAIPSSSNSIRRLIDLIFLFLFPLPFPFPVRFLPRDDFFSFFSPEKTGRKSGRCLSGKSTGQVTRPTVHDHARCGSTPHGMAGRYDVMPLCPWPLPCHAMPGQPAHPTVLLRDAHAMQCDAMRCNAIMTGSFFILQGPSS